MENTSSNANSSLSGEGGSSETGAEESQDEEPASSSSVRGHSELDEFRQRWRRELENIPSQAVQKAREADVSNSNEDSIEDKAKYYFLCGVQAERMRRLDDAIALYRKAIQLVPDIEFKVEECKDAHDLESKDNSDDEDNFEMDNEGDSDYDNLLEKFQKPCLTNSFTICKPKVEKNTTHISCLPQEIFIYILKWVVSQELDVVSLEQISKVCRGFYICARDNSLWKLICQRTWDMCVDTPNRYGSWRTMFLQRPHLSFNGVYISKTTYVRYGDSSFTDVNYRPCYLVEYYRYLRFFPDGNVLMLTTPDDPYQSLYKLRSRKSKHPNIMSGRYKLIGSTVVAVLRKQKCSENVQNYFRVRRPRQVHVVDAQDQTFHVEVEVKSNRKRINCQLIWNRYAVHSLHRNGEETTSNFDIVPSKFPSFWFSRVKSYTAESDSPLK